MTIRDYICESAKVAVIGYEEGAGEIILMVDASPIGWGAVLLQVQNGRRVPVRFDSGTWDKAESKYDQLKRETRAVLIALRKLGRYVFGVPFTLETDARVLVDQLNGAASDLPGSFVQRWVAVIRQLDFTVRHIKGTKNVVADALSRKPPHHNDWLERERLGDMEQYIDNRLDSITLNQTLIEESDQNDKPQTSRPQEDKVLEGTWSDEYQKLARFLVTGVYPPTITRNERRALIRGRMHFMVRQGALWRRPERDNPHRRVVDDQEEQRRLIQNLHTELGHRGLEVTFKRISTGYWWKGMYKDVREALRSCLDCQARDPKRPIEPHRFTAPQPAIFTKWHIDIQHMPNCKGFKYLLEARCDLTGFVVAKPLWKNDADNTKKFLWNQIICEYGMPMKVVVDGGPENREQLKQYCEEIGIKRVVISAYNPAANGAVEVGHASIANMLSKLTGGTGTNWLKHLPIVIFADRTSIHSPHGRTPFELVYGHEALLPIETEIPTWRVLEWDEVETKEDLVLLRTRMLLRKETLVEKAAKAMAKARKAAAEHANLRDQNRMRPSRLIEQDMVLTYDVPRSKDMSTSTKLTYRWNGPFRVLKVLSKNNYQLCDLTGTPLAGTYAANRVKKFIQDKEGWWQEDDPMPNQKEEEDQNESSMEEEDIPQTPKEDGQIGQDMDESDQQADESDSSSSLVYIVSDLPQQQ